MNVKAIHVQMMLHALTISIRIIASVNLGLTTLTVKMVPVKALKTVYELPFALTEINECESSPCSNDGTCVDAISGYHCICKPGFNYTHCENSEFYT